MQERIIRAVFEYALTHDRQKVSRVHKANILNILPGYFLEVGKKVAKDYSGIEFEDLIIDNMAMQMVMRPERFDVVVTTNLFGDVLSPI